MHMDDLNEPGAVPDMPAAPTSPTYTPAPSTGPMDFASAAAAALLNGTDGKPALTQDILAGLLRNTPGFLAKLGKDTGLDTGGGNLNGRIPQTLNDLGARMGAPDRDTVVEPYVPGTPLNQPRIERAPVRRPARGATLRGPDGRQIVPPPPPPPKMTSEGLCDLFGKLILDALRNLDPRTAGFSGMTIEFEENGSSRVELWLPITDEDGQPGVEDLAIIEGDVWTLSKQIRQALGEAEQALDGLMGPAEEG